MKVLIEKASDRYYEEVKEINTLIELDTIINDLEKHGDEAPAPSKEELCKIFNILKEVSK